jgi:hypothetical protein
MAKRTKTASTKISTGAAAVASAPNKNRHVVDAIRAYCEFRYPQRHALMVNGKWGSGKTYLLEEVGEGLVDRRLSGDRNKPLYITLYGVKDAAEIGEQIYQQMHPFLSHKGTRFVGALMKGILKTTVKIDLSELHQGNLSLGSQLPDVRVSELLEGATQRVIIFDDFERAIMSPVELLGYINPFVEHDGCKVIILANEENLKDVDGTYKDRKEKTVGQTLQVTADVEAAFRVFMLEIDTADLRAYYDRHRADIVAVFADSELDNLRLLKQFLWDFEKLWNLLTLDQRKHDQAILEIMLVLFAWTLEIRSNRVDSAAFAYERLVVDMAFTRKDPDEKFRPFREMTRRYHSVRFESTLLSRATIKGIILRSEFPTGEIQAQLTAHPYFTEPKDLPSWKSLWYAHEQSADAIPDIMSRFDADFESRRYTEDAEILHIAGLCLWISDLGQPGWVTATVVTRIKNYVDDVYNDRPGSSKAVLPARSLHDMFGGSYGLGYRNADDSRFKEIVAYLRNKVAAWRERGLPILAKELLLVMVHDSDAFLHQVCPTGAGPGTYSRLPVLRAIEPADFVAAFAEQNAEGRRKILLTLGIRYEHLQIDTDLAIERPWLRDVYDKLIAYADGLGPIPRGALKEGIKSYLEKVIPVLEVLVASGPLVAGPATPEPPLT